jgi:hypothetical protein
MGHSRIVTVKSRPGSDPVAVGTAVISKLNSPPPASAGNPNPLTTGLDTVVSAAIVNVQ